MTERISESDFVVPALRLMLEKPDGFISTENLIKELEHIFNPTGKDAEIIEGRSDTYFSQKVRNLISHRQGNFISRGLANYVQDKEGLRITAAGKHFISQL